MDAFALLRTMGALGVVLGLLIGALWIVRRYNISFPGALPTNGHRRLALVERIAVDGRRSVALVRRDGCEHLILLAPEGHVLIESGIAAPVPAAEPEAAPLSTVTPTQDFAALVDRFASTRGALRPHFERALVAIRTHIWPRVIEAQVKVRAHLRPLLDKMQPYIKRVRARLSPRPAPSPSPAPPPRSARPRKPSAPRKN